MYYNTSSYLLLLFDQNLYKPDLDNIAKIVLDSLNGLAYKDDRQVVSLKIEKHYADKPLVKVELYEVEYE